MNAGRDGAPSTSADSFAALGVPEQQVNALARHGITTPFPIQVATIPDALAGRDLCGKAHTGSGKTLAFALPMAARVRRSAPKRPKGLVLAPTRELALQVADELRMVSGELRVLAVYGGAGIEPQLKALRAGVDIVVACPGRLLDVIDRKACDLRDVSLVVIDEADRMADMGFLPDVRRLLDQTSTKRQTVLFSATLDGAVDTLVRDYQTNPVIHELPEEAPGEVTHRFWTVDRSQRVQLTAEIVERGGPTVVFSRTRHGADRIARQLAALGVSAAAIHGNRSQGQRERALGEFHRGEVKALVATDVAARGIHVDGVACVVHFDLPADPKDYVHRSGRTGRAGNDGTVVALVGPNQHREARSLARAAGVEVELQAPDVASVPAGHAGFRARASRPRRSGSQRSERARPAPRPADRPTSRSGPSTRDPDRARTRTRGGPAPAGEKPKRSKPPSGRSVDPLAVPAAGRSSDGASSRRREAPAGGPETRDRPARNSGPARKSGPVRDSGPARKSGRAEHRQSAESAATGDRLERAMAASPKVRPSGASRRKAKREALLAAGVDPADLRKPKRRR